MGIISDAAVVSVALADGNVFGQSLAAPDKQNVAIQARVAAFRVPSRDYIVSCDYIVWLATSVCVLPQQVHVSAEDGHRLCPEFQQLWHALRLATRPP